MSKKIVIGSSMKFRSLVKSTMKELENLGYQPLFPNLDYSSEDRDVVFQQNNIKVKKNKN